jgi:hypothetical protein
VSSVERLVERFTESARIFIQIDQAESAKSAQSAFYLTDG